MAHVKQPIHVKGRPVTSEEIAKKFDLSDGQVKKLTDLARRTLADRSCAKCGKSSKKR